MTKDEAMDAAGAAIVLQALLVDSTCFDKYDHAAIQIAIAALRAESVAGDDAQKICIEPVDDGRGGVRICNGVAPDAADHHWHHYVPTSEVLPVDELALLRAKADCWTAWRLFEAAAPSHRMSRGVAFEDAERTLAALERKGG